MVVNGVGCCCLRFEEAVTHPELGHANLDTPCMHHILPFNKSDTTSSWKNVMSKMFWHWAQCTIPATGVWQWLLQICVVEPWSTSTMLDTDEVSFTWQIKATATIFRHVKTHPQHLNESKSNDFSSIWTWYYSYFSKRPYVLSACLTGPVYKDILEQSLPELLQNVTRSLPKDMVYAQTVPQGAHKNTWMLSFLHSGFGTTDLSFGLLDHPN